MRGVMGTGVSCTQAAALSARGCRMLARDSRDRVPTSALGHKGSCPPPSVAVLSAAEDAPPPPPSEVRCWAKADAEGRLSGDHDMAVSSGGPVPV